MIDVSLGLINLLRKIEIKSLLLYLHYSRKSASVNRKATINYNNLMNKSSPPDRSISRKRAFAPIVENRKPNKIVELNRIYTVIKIFMLGHPISEPRDTVTKFLSNLHYFRYLEGSTQKSGKWHSLYDLHIKEAMALTLFCLHALLRKWHWPCFCVDDFGALYAIIHALK